MRRAVLLLVLTLTTVVLAVLPAAAGGPTSVMVTVPGAGRSTALYYTDTAYERLSDAIGVGREVDPVRGPDFGAQNPVTLTWLIHDVTVWRVDRVYVHRGRTFVLTTQDPGGDLRRAETVLHEAGPELMPLLRRLLPAGNGYLKDTAVDVPDPAPAAAAPVVTRTQVERPSPLPLVGLGVGGLLVGVLGTVLALAVRRRSETATPADTEVSTGEQLVWP